MEDASSQRCVLGVRRLRQAVLFGVCGVAVLWVLFGSYGHHHETISRARRTGTLTAATGLRSSLMADIPDECHYDPNNVNVDIEVGS